MTRRKTLRSFIGANGDSYKVGDCCLLTPEHAEEFPYIGKVLKISAEVGDADVVDPADVDVKVTWYYRPEEAVRGRKSFHGARELFQSSHVDVIKAASVFSHCRVVSLEAYQMLPEIKPNDFYTRFHYNPVNQTFTPDRIVVHCKCELPYNPDQAMLMCDQCQEWFHPACVGLAEEAASFLPQFICSDCEVQAATVGALASTISDATEFQPAPYPTQH